MGCGASRQSTRIVPKGSTRVERKTAGAAQGFFLYKYTEHDGPINCTALSEDESLLVTGSEDTTLKLWSTFAEPPEVIGTLRGHKSYITACTVHGSYVLSASADNTIKKWYILDASCVHTFEGHTARVTRLFCSGQFIFSASMDYTLRAWFFNADRLYEQEEAEEEAALEHQPKPTLDILDEIEQQLLATKIQHRKSSVRSDFELKQLQRKQIKASREASGVYAPIAEELEDIPQEKLTPDCINVFRGHDKGVFSIIFVPCEDTGEEDALIENDDITDLLISGSADCTVRMWDLYTGQTIRVLRGHTRPINDMAVESSGRHLFTAGGEGVIRQWHLETGDCLRTLQGHRGPVVCLLAHGRMLYSGSTDGTARSWVMEFGESTRIYRGANKTVACLRYYDRMLYTGSGDCLARMYEAKSGSHKRTFRGHEHSVTSLEVVNGRAFTASFDGSVYVWDTTGVVDETVFGAEEEESEEELSDDDDRVKNVLKLLDPFIHEG